MITPPGFSERIFEFGFNAEYADRYKAVLAGIPHIPTQNQEKSLGYDIKFEIASHHGASRYLALQHKVSRYVDGLSSSNRRFREHVGSPYYAFRIDVDQFNLIEKAASSKSGGLDFYYCAPLFHTSIAMNERYVAKDVEKNSVWIDVQGAGQLSLTEAHTMVYSPDGATAFVFSENPRRLRVSIASNKARSPERRSTVAAASPEDLVRFLNTDIENYYKNRPRPSPKQVGSPHKFFEGLQASVQPQISAIHQLADVVTKQFGATLLVETAESIELQNLLSSNTSNFSV